MVATLCPWPVILLVTLLLLLQLPQPASGLYSLGIRDSIMIAHSFKGEQFGPAQQMHGATYTVDVEFSSSELVPDSNWVIDIGHASDMLGKILSKYNFKNLDTVFPGENTTTEFMCKQIFDEVAQAVCGGGGGEGSADGEKEEGFRGSVCVKLFESHKAWACYSGTVG